MGNKWKKLRPPASLFMITLSFWLYKTRMRTSHSILESGFRESAENADV